MKLIVSTNEFKALVKDKLVKDMGKGRFQLFISRGDKEMTVDVEVDTAAQGAQTPKESARNPEAMKVESWIQDWRKGKQTPNGDFSGFFKKKPGAMGDYSRCVRNMKRFLLENPQYTKEDVFKARDLYFEYNMEAFGSYKYMREAHYFIRKEEKENGELVVKEDLLKFCEELEDGGYVKKGASRITEQL